MDTERTGWAEVIRVSREASGMTQRQLADEASISLKSVGNAETGTTSPQRGTLDKIRAVLGLSSDLLVARDQADRLVAHGPPVAPLDDPAPASRLPAQRPQLDRYLRDLEGRVRELELRVADLEVSEVTDTHLSSVALDEPGCYEEQEASNLP